MNIIDYGVEMKKVLVIFTEVMDYGLDLIHNVYEKTTHQYDYVYCNKSVSGHKYSGVLPENSAILVGNNLRKLIAITNIIRKRKYDLVIINGYSGIIEFAAILLCKKLQTPYAIESDTQLRIPEQFLKRWAKYFYLKLVFRGICFGFAGGSRQRILFEFYGMPLEKIFTLPMTVDVEKLQREFQKLHCYKVIARWPDEARCF